MAMCFTLHSIRYTRPLREANRGFHTAGGPRLTVTASCVSELRCEHGLLGYNRCSGGAQTPLASIEFRLCKFLRLTGYTSGLYLSVEQQDAWATAGSRKAEVEKVMCLHGQRDRPGVRVGVQERRGARVRRDRTKAGISLKVKDMPKCHGPIKVLEKGEVGDFAASGGGKTNPRGAKIRCGNEIQEFRPKQTQASYVPWDLRVTGEIGPFFSKFQCERRSIKDSVYLLESPQSPV